MKNPIAVSALLALSLFGCKSSPAVPDAPETPFVPTGGVVFRGGNASFDATRVRGPLISASRRADGDWGGRINGQALDVTVTPDRIVGSYLNMAIEHSPKGLVITGQWMGQIHRFELSNDQLMVRLPRASFTLARSGEGEYGPGGAAKLTGEALKPDAPMPQLALALLATFLASETPR